MNINELKLEEMGTWPWAAKAVVIGVVVTIIMLLFIMLDVRSLNRKISVAQTEQQTLRTAFQQKYMIAGNLPAYQAQVNQMQSTIVELVQRLPKILDIPNLIEDISKTGLESGLTFKSIKPQPEIVMQYYTILPINISVQGDYYQLGDFVAGLAKLKRIVTLDNITISRVYDKEQKNTSATNQATGASAQDYRLLQMDFTARTYRQNSTILSKENVTNDNANTDKK